MLAGLLAAHVCLLVFWRRVFVPWHECSLIIVASEYLQCFNVISKRVCMGACVLATGRDMRSVCRALFNVFVLALLFSCDGSQIAYFSGYVVNITNQSVVLDYSLVVMIPSQNKSVKVNVDSTGLYRFSIPRYSDYLVSITKTGFNDFNSLNRVSILSETDHKVNSDNQFYFNAYLIPATLKSPQVNVNVYSRYSGELLSGFYKVSATTAATSMDERLHGSGNSSAGWRWWVPTPQVLSGSFSNGLFEIAEGSLIPGYLHEVTLFGVDGYQDQTSSISLGTTNLNTISYVDLEMTDLARVGLPVVIGMSHLDSEGMPVSINPARTISITFDRGIFLRNRAFGRGAHSILSVNPTTDDDLDTVTTSTTMSEETVGSNGLSTRVTVSSSANVLTITFAADSTLIDGTIDTGDDLSYTLQEAWLAEVFIADGMSTNSNWTSLSAIMATPDQRTVVVREQYP